MYVTLFVGVLCWSLFDYALLGVLSSFLIVSYTCSRLFLTVPWVGLYYVVVVFPDHAHLLYEKKMK